MAKKKDLDKILDVQSCSLFVNRVSDKAQEMILKEVFKLSKPQQLLLYARVLNRMFFNFYQTTFAGAEKVENKYMLSSSIREDLPL